MHVDKDKLSTLPNRHMLDKVWKIIMLLFIVASCGSVDLSSKIGKLLRQNLQKVAFIFTV